MWFSAALKNIRPSPSVEIRDAAALADGRPELARIEEEKVPDVFFRRIEELLALALVRDLVDLPVRGRRGIKRPLLVPDERGHVHFGGLEPELRLAVLVDAVDLAAVTRAEERHAVLRRQDREIELLLGGRDLLFLGRKGERAVVRDRDAVELAPQIIVPGPELPLLGHDGLEGRGQHEGSEDGVQNAFAHIEGSYFAICGCGRGWSPRP
jgi:hypothetical protein